MFVERLRGYTQYILLFVIRKIIFISIQKLFFSLDIQILKFCNLKFHDFINCRSMKQEIHFAE